MHSVYNRVAGQNVERIAASATAFFTVAMTLRVLDPHVPAAEAVRSVHDPGALSPKKFLLSLICHPERDAFGLAKDPSHFRAASGLKGCSTTTPELRLCACSGRAKPRRARFQSVRLGRIPRAFAVSAFSASMKWASTIAPRTSFRRWRARSGCSNGEKREGDLIIPASNAASPSRS